MAVKRKKIIKFLTLYNSFSPIEKNEFQNYLKNNSINHRNYNRILSSLKINDRGIADIDGTESGITRWNRLSELNLLAENFLLQNSIESDDIMKSSLLLKEYGKRNLESSYIQKYKKLKKVISKKPVVNYDYNLVSQTDILNLIYLKKSARAGRAERDFIETYNFRFGTFIFELLELMLEINTQRKEKLLVSDLLAGEIFSGLKFERILPHLSGNPNISNKLYALIRFLYSLCLCEADIYDKKSYLTAKRIFFRDLKSISAEKRTSYYTYLINYNIERLNNLVPGAFKELFYLMNKKIKEGLTGDLKERNPALNQFRNYIITGINLKKYNWVSKLIKNFGPFLPSSVKENDILMGKSHLLFAKKKYSACIGSLVKIKKLNPYYFIDISILKLKTLYELKNIVECHNELKNLKEYLRKDRIVNNNLIIYSKYFLRAFTLLLKLNQNPTANNLLNLQYFLSKKNFIAKKWFILKMEVIEGKLGIRN